MTLCDDVTIFLAHQKAILEARQRDLEARQEAKFRSWTVSTKCDLRKLEARQTEVLDQLRSLEKQVEELELHDDGMFTKLLDVDETVP